MKIPYGIHDYKTIKAEDYLFVDKTNFIKKLEDIGRYIVFLRPRRFGKSLFTSMLYYYYDLNSINIFNDLFKDTYIGENETSEANNYYILKFDFSGINTEKDALEKDFYDCVCIYLHGFIKHYNLEIKLNKDTQKVNTLTKDFLSQFSSKTDKQIYLIIDEYDHFANNVLTSDLQLFNEITGKDGFVRNFYEVFKTYAGTAIGRMFITGVTPITLDSLTSGFNMAENFSKHESLNEMMGFTEHEVADILEKYKIDKIYINNLKENYNGYSFSEDVGTRVYNSNMILYYVKRFILSGKPPKSLTDPNIISDYTKITRMFNLYHDKEDKEIIIKDILTSKPVATPITDIFNIKLTFSRKDFLSLLYYLGLLTIADNEGPITELKTPNYIIQNVYFEYYYHYLNEMLNINLDVWHIEEAVLELSMHNNIHKFIKVVEKFLHELSNRDYIKFDEKYVKLIMLTYLRLSTSYLVKSEYEVSGEYPDISLLPNYVYTAPNYFIIEIKYLSKADATDNAVEKKRQGAVKQVNGYAQSMEFINIPNLRKYVIVVVKDECRVVEEIK